MVEISPTNHYSILIHGLDNPKEWVDIWSKYYSYKDEEKYTNNIRKALDSQEAFMSLFEWKNGYGDKISNKKKIPLKSYYQKINLLRTLKISFEWDLFEKEFLPYKNATIWKIFLLHITNPDEFPIFDQHVYRAFTFVKTGEITNVALNSNSQLYQIYKNEYKPWFNSLRKTFNLDPKQMDEALFSFGKFLKEIKKYPFEILIKN